MDKAKGSRKKSKKSKDSGLEITVTPTCQPASTNTEFTEIEIMPVTSVEIEIEPIFEYHEMDEDQREAGMDEEDDPIGVEPQENSESDYQEPSSMLIEVNQDSNSATEGMIVACDECGEEFNYTPPTTDNEEVFLCNRCNVQYEHRYRNVKYFACPICKRRFSRRYYLTSHIKATHIGENPFVCDICLKTFPEKNNMTIHMKLAHADQMRYRCKFCKKQFSLKSTLTIHERKHSGIKPFTCSVCNYQFAQRSHLNAHERLHSGEKPFSCDICHKQFSKKHHLSVHATVHSGEKPYSCDICNKRFSQKSSVNVHKRRFVCVMQTKC